MVPGSRHHPGLSTHLLHTRAQARTKPVQLRGTSVEQEQLYQMRPCSWDAQIYQEAVNTQPVRLQFLQHQAFRASHTVFQSTVQTLGHTEPLYTKQWHRKSVGNQALLFGGRKSIRGDYLLLLSPVDGMEILTSTNAAKGFYRRKPQHPL